MKTISLVEKTYPTNSKILETFAQNIIFVQHSWALLEIKMIQQFLVSFNDKTHCISFEETKHVCVQDILDHFTVRFLCDTL